MSLYFDRITSKTLHKVTSVLGACLLSGVVFSWSKQEAFGQSCNYFAGTAVGGQKVNLNTCSINRANYTSVNFVYFLGNKKFRSQANCNNGTWTTFSNGQVHRPQSQATQNMIDVVCSYR
jgi:hypothetical protein